MGEKQETSNIEGQNLNQQSGFFGTERGAPVIPQRPNERGEALDEVRPTGLG